MTARAEGPPTATRPLRLVHLLGNLNFGGLQGVVRALALSQVRAGHQVTVTYRSGPGNHPEGERELEAAGVRLIQFRQPTDRRGAPLRRLRHILRAASADLLHVHTPVNYYPFATVAARWAGVPAIVNTLHIAKDLERLGRKDTALFWAATAFTSDLTVSVCAEVQAAVEARFRVPARKLTVVENGVDLSRFLGVTRRPAGREVVLGAVGRMVDIKDHRVLLEAFALARREHPDIRLRLLGGGPLEADLRAQATRLGLDEVVEFCGFSHDVPGFLRDVDIYVMSSNSEGLPLSLLEAIATGLPVVATTVGGIPDIVTRSGAGWLAPPRSGPALAEAIGQALADPTRRERGEQARQVVADHYSTERMAADYARLYTRLLGRERG